MMELLSVFLNKIKKMMNKFRLFDGIDILGVGEELIVVFFSEIKLEYEEEVID